MPADRKQSPSLSRPPADRPTREREPEERRAREREQEQEAARRRADDMVARYRNSDGDAVTTNSQAGTVGGQLDGPEPQAERKR